MHAHFALSGNGTVPGTSAVREMLTILFFSLPELSCLLAPQPLPQLLLSSQSDE